MDKSGNVVWEKYNVKGSKKMKKKISFLILLCLIFAAVWSKAPAVVAASKAQYRIVTEQRTWKDGKKVRGIVSFQYPLLKGNSKAVEKINETLKKAAEDYFESESAKNLKEYTLEAIAENRFYDESEQYYFETSCSVTYNKNNVISIGMTERWYAGGVSNHNEYGYTFDLKTGKQLSITDVVKGNSKEVKNKILAAAKQYFQGEGSGATADWKEIEPIIKKMKLAKMKFYLTPGKANICFGSYDLVYNFSACFDVESIYK